jgi:hypothetical protein
MRVFLIYFFDYVVAKVIWRHVSDFLGFEIGTDYLTVASKWLHMLGTELSLLSRGRMTLGVEIFF